MGGPVPGSPNSRCKKDVERQKSHVLVVETATTSQLICFYLFLEYVRPQQLYTVLDILPWAQLTIISTFFAYLFQRGKKESLLDPMTMLFVIFVLHVLVSSWLAYSPNTSFENINVIISWILIYGLIISIVNTERRFVIFLALFFLFNFKMSQHGFRAWMGRGFSFSPAFHGAVRKT